jgi:hypothetical protein
MPDQKKGRGKEEPLDLENFQKEFIEHVNKISMVFK